jgi:hypothetical protein
MKPADYYLEIYHPGSRRNCWMEFTSSTPFMAINKGDIVNPGIWPGSQVPTKALRVTGVEHVIWDQGGQAKHKVMVFSEAVDYGQR